MRYIGNEGKKERKERRDEGWKGVMKERGKEERRER